MTVDGIDRRWRFDRRNANLNNGYSVTSDVIYDYFNGGNSWLGDGAIVRAGRTIYRTPKRNDTIFWKTPKSYIDNGSGYMMIGSPENGARNNFYNTIKQNLHAGS